MLSTTASQNADQSVREVTLGQAIREALAEEMRRDPRVFIMGEDVAEAGTPFKVLSGLVEEFGTARVIDTPISEAGITGLGVGGEFAVGVSLGGSALLNWLGREEHRAASIIAAAAAVSAPLDLAAAGIAIEQGLNRIYSRHFRATLVPKAMAMAQQFPGTLDAAAIARVDTMYAFDDVVTAPLHGFAGTDDYWKRASSKPWLKAIAVPTLVLNARNDPFIPASSLPVRAEAGPAITLEQPDHGGHAGFPEQRFPGGLDWLPQRLITYFNEVRGA